MTGNVYSVSFTSIAITADQELLTLVINDDYPITILGVTLFQTLDVGDAAEEILPLRIHSGLTTIGSGGGVPIIEPMNTQTPAAQATARRNDDTIMVTGTNAILFEDGWNVRMPYSMFFPEGGYRPIAHGADTHIAFQLVLDPSDSLTCSGWMLFKEGESG